MAFGVGDTIGAYQIIECVGQGGMATIFRARQIALDRDVALKVIHPALMQDESFHLRLSREASIVAGLYHPNIVPIFDYGQVDGVPFIVMRFIEGKTLKAVLQDHPLGMDQILPIARAIGSALQYAHRHSVLHRDVKPSNILIDPDENVFLTDFGLARITYSAESTLSREMMIGSPHYISPEQAKGELVDERSDLYSFGIVLFEMFTGRVPFSADTPYATVLAHINEPPPLAHTVNPKTPFAIERVLERALAKDREDRYPSMAVLMEALEEVVRQQQPKQVSAPGLSPSAPAGAYLVPAPRSSRIDSARPSGSLLRNRAFAQFWILVIIGALVWCALVASIAMGVPGTAAPPKPTPPDEKPAAAFVAASISSPKAEGPLPPTSAVPSALVLAYSPAPTVARPSTPVPASATDTSRGHIDVLIINADGSGVKQLTFGQGNDRQLNWSRDGATIYWRSDQNGVGWAIYAMRSDGSSAHLVIDDVPPDANLWGRESLSTGL